jgi:hypothetical protein
MMETTMNRRRSQRLFLQVPVIVEGRPAGKPPLSETTHTIIVNAHGALVELSVSLEQGQTVTLQNARTNEKSECAIRLIMPGEAGKFNTALEFIKPNPGFWRISFPPEDWNLRHPDAKKNG